MTTGSGDATKTKRGHAVPRSWLRFGPGLLVALVVIWLLWPRLFPPNPASPVVERTRLDVVPATLASAPDPAWLLAQRESLKLSAAQFQKLSRLRARWERDTRTLRAALDNASARFNRDMAEDTAARRSVTVERLQERAAPVAELSRQLSQARRAWWGGAAEVLSIEQRQRAEQAWAQRFSKKPAAAEKSGDTKS